MRTCRVCGTEKPDAKMLGHLGGAHRINAQKYADQFPDEDPIDKSANIAGGASTYRRKLKNTPEDKVHQELSPEEQDYFTKFCAEMMQQIDRDATQITRLSALAFDTILLMRLQKQSFINTKKAKIVLDKDLNTVMKEVEARVDAKFKLLGIDRQSKINSKQQVKSTPSAIISAYMDEIQRQTPEVQETLLREEEKALAEVEVIIKKLYYPRAVKLVKEVEKEDESGQVRDSLDLDAAILRANIEF